MTSLPRVLTSGAAPMTHIAAGALALSLAALDGGGVLPLYLRLGIGVVLALGLGLPHGALDWWATRRMQVRPQLLPFLGFYLATMAVMGMIWWVSPRAGAAAFLLISLIHFGESDTVRLGLEPQQHLRIALLRGTFVMALISGSAAKQTATVLALWGWDVDPAFLARVTPVIAAAMLLVVVLEAIETPALWRLAGDNALLAVVFSVGTPLFAFVLYMGLSHGWSHLQTLQRHAPRGAWRSMILEGVFFTLPVALAFGVYMHQTGGTLSASALSAALVVVSLVTAPHAVLVSRFFGIGSAPAAFPPPLSVPTATQPRSASV